MSPTTALRASVIALLRADAALASAMGGAVRIFDFTPERAAMPFLAWEAEAAPFDTAASRGADITLTLHCFSRREGRLEAETVLRRVYELLHEGEASLALAAPWSAVHARWQFADVFPEESGQTYHGVIRFRVVVEES